MKTPSNDYEALLMALMLAITAPETAHQEEAVAAAEDIASRLSELDILRAKWAVETALQSATSLHDTEGGGA